MTTFVINEQQIVLSNGTSLKTFDTLLVGEGHFNYYFSTGQLFDAQDNPLGAPFQIGTGSIHGGASYPPLSLAALAGGGFVAAWIDENPYELRLQRFDNAGTAQGPAVLEENPYGRLTEHRVDALPDGGYVFSFVGVYGNIPVAYRFDADGNAIGGRFVFQGIDNLPSPDSTPVFTNDGGADVVAITVAENRDEFSPLVNFTAVDADGDAPLFTITGDADGKWFTLDANTGQLSFWFSPDFETPRDADHDNVYEVIVRASDGLGHDEQTILVTVSDVVDPGDYPPLITSDGGGDTASIAVNETIVQVTDVDADHLNPGSNAYSISGGADAALFDINPTTGALRFRTTRDFENPVDADHDNVYDVVVRATFTSNLPEARRYDEQAIAVHIVDVAEAVTGTSGDDLLQGSAGADIMAGLRGNDIYVVTAGDQVMEKKSQGIDTITSSAIGFTLADHVENGAVTGQADLDLTGNMQANVLTGNDGANVINGGGGKDMLTGGLGADAFRFDLIETSAHRDTIADFVSGTDRIELAVTAFSALADYGPGALEAGELAFGKAATSADQHLVYDIAKGALYYDADGAGGTAQIMIALLGGKPAIEAGDIVLV